MKEKIALDINTCLIIAATASLVASAMIIATKLMGNQEIIVHEEDISLEDLEKEL